MLEEVGLLLEFWDKAVKYDAYIRNRTDLGPIINGSVINPQEAFTRATPLINYIRVWGSKCCLYINLKTIPLE